MSDRSIRGPRGVLLVVLLLLACRDKAPPREFDGPSAFRYIERQLEFGYRIPGTEGHRRMAAWLDSTVRAKADSVITQRWTHVTGKGDSLPLQNVIARFNPGAEKRILFLAHWDTRPTADGPRSPDSTAAVMGANDGASGVALLLGVADVLKRRLRRRAISAWTCCSPTARTTTTSPRRRTTS